MLSALAFSSRFPFCLRSNPDTDRGIYLLGKHSGHRFITGLQWNPCSCSYGGRGGGGRTGLAKIHMGEIKCQDMDSNVSKMFQLNHRTVGLFFLRKQLHVGPTFYFGFCRDQLLTTSLDMQHMCAIHLIKY